MKRFKALFIFFSLVLILIGCDGKTKTENKDNTNHVHEYEETVYEPSCETQGYSLFICVCGNEYKDKYKEPYGHSWDKGVVKVEPSCSEGGSIEYTCLLDPEHKKEENISALGHTEGDWTLKREKTCLEDGKMIKTCIRCDYVYEEKTIEKGHVTDNYKVQIEPTCTKDGLEVLICSTCFEIIDERPIEKAEHSLTEEFKIIESTCSSLGYKKEYCSSCKDWITIEEYEMVEHVPGIKTLSINPSCTKPGLSVIKCVNCDVVLEKFVENAIGHTIIKYDSVEATCIENGMEEGFGCSRCDYIESGMRFLPALGHDASAITMTSAFGHSYDECVCSRCQIEFRDNLVVDYKELYGYNYIKNNYEKGTIYATLYSEFYNVSLNFMNDTNDYTDEGEGFIIKRIYFNCTNEKCTKNHRKYQLSSDEVAMVWRTFTYENPQFMFLWNGYTYGKQDCNYLIYKYSTDFINLVVSKEYAKYEYRKEILEKLSILNAIIAQEIDVMKGEEYIAKDIHDFICDRIHYSYLEDGVTPDESKNAHNMVGFIMDKKGVCECYAKSFQYYSYLYGINTLTAASTTHMWNITEIDGHWYGMDLTWDDGEKIRYTYFGASKGLMNMSEAHELAGSEFGIGYLTPLPELSTQFIMVNDSKITLPIYGDASNSYTHKERKEEYI